MQEKLVEVTIFNNKRKPISSYFVTAVGHEKMDGGLVCLDEDYDELVANLKDELKVYDPGSYAVARFFAGDGAGPFIAEVDKE